MTEAQRLALVRGVHTAIYMAMAASTLTALYAGVSGARGAWLWTALGLLSIEIVVFVGNGFRCPLTAVAIRYGAKIGGPYDTFLPERFTRYTFLIFGPLITLSLLLLIARWRGLLG